VGSLARSRRIALWQFALAFTAMSRPGPPKEYTKAQRRRHDQEERRARVTRYQIKIDWLRALARTHEQRGDKQEARRIGVRIRALEQRVRYINFDQIENRKTEEKL
jgi:hypothetical protein